MKKALLLFFMIFNTYFTVQALEKIDSILYAYKRAPDDPSCQKFICNTVILEKSKKLFKKAFVGAACLLTANSCFACYATTTCLECVGCTCALCAAQIPSAYALKPLLEVVDTEPTILKLNAPIPNEPNTDHSSYWKGPHY